HLFLPTAKAVEAEDVLQHGKCACDAVHARLMAEAIARATVERRFSPCPVPRACALSAAKI
ncbi:MAG: hypothetical protein VX465_03860, partial [Pseudomonadota bacterium]|nr:hypothetical protein [Pseudomonadota bacterium]